MLTESERAFHQTARLAEKSIDFPFARHFLAVIFDQLGFVIVSIQVANASTCTNVDNAPGFGAEMRRLGGIRKSWRATGSRSRAGAFLVQQPCQGDSAQPRSDVPQ